jgi:decaprenyl-phosphate phosphoribosyltransferase
MRPHQWTKNVLVAAVPLAAGKLLAPAILLQTLAAFIVFCLAASATYLINDTVDAEADRAHPTKHTRPIAAGELAPRAAVIAALALIVIAELMALLVAPELAAVLAAYVAVTLSYSLWLKHEPVIEMAFLALGFLLRAIAGGAATGIAVSSWFLIVAGFGSLFMAAGKRSSELNSSLGTRPDDDAPKSTRRVLTGYTPGYLRFVWATAASVTITAYCLWAFEVAVVQSTLPWAKLSIIPFVLAIMRYAVDIDRDTAEAPDRVVLSDRTLLGMGVLWVVTFGLGALGV